MQSFQLLKCLNIPLVQHLATDLASELLVHHWPQLEHLPPAALPWVDLVLGHLPAEVVGVHEEHPGGELAVMVDGWCWSSEVSSPNGWSGGSGPRAILAAVMFNSHYFNVCTTISACKML